MKKNSRFTSDSDLTKENLFQEILYMYIFSAPELEKPIEKLFEKYKHDAWKAYKKSPLREVQFVNIVPVKRYMQLCKIIGVWTYMQDCYAEYNNGKIDIAEEISRQVEDIIYSYCGIDFLKALRTNDLEKVLKHIETFEYDKQLHRAISKLFLVYLQNIALFFNLPNSEMYLSFIESAREKYFVRQVDFEKATENEVKTYNNKIIEYKLYHDVDYKWRSIGELDYKTSANDTTGKTEKFASGMLEILTLYGIDIESFDNDYPINKNEWKVLLSKCAKYDVDDPIFLWVLTILRLISKAYSDSRNLFYQHNDAFSKLEEKVIKDNTKEIERLNKKHSKLLDEKDAEIERLRKEYRIGIERELLEKDKQIESLQELLESSYERKIKEEEILYKEETHLEFLETFVDSSEIVVVGGYPKLQQRLKDYFPNVIFESDPTRIKNKSKVFLLTRYVDHATTYLIGNKIKYHNINSYGVNIIANDIKNLMGGKTDS